jgi:MFS family permease
MRLSRLGPALQEPDFARLWFGLIGMRASLEMLEVVIGWQVYSLHHSALELGWIGLAQFLPMFLLALPAGQLADRISRRLVLAAALGLGAVVSAALAVVTLVGAGSLAVFLGLAVAAGASMALGSPAGRAMPPTLVAPELLPSAMTLRSIAMQGSQALGPALGGLLFPLSPAVAYGTAGALSLAGAGAVLRIRSRPPSAAPSAPGLDSVLGGIRFVRRTPILLGAILLDLFAVLFGGAVALLPLFAASILHVGPVGLGLLRAAPAIGALCAAAYLTWRPIGRRAGRALLIAVGTFGASMIVFGLSRWAPLSFAALAVSGFSDLFSVNVRSTTVALATPDDLRGRVVAVEMVFVSASNQLGAFESGVAAAALGAVGAVVSGGVVTIVLALTWSRLFPSLAAVDRLDRIRPTQPVTKESPDATGPLGRHRPARLARVPGDDELR